jgi:hypothetical protein
MGTFALVAGIYDRVQKLRFESNYPLKEQEQAINDIVLLAHELGQRAASPQLFDDQPAVDRT